MKWYYLKEKSSTYTRTCRIPINYVYDGFIHEFIYVYNAWYGFSNRLVVKNMKSAM